MAGKITKEELHPLLLQKIDDFAAHEADKEQHIGYATASGTNTYTASITGITSLSEGLSVKVKFTNANTGASTLNINGLGAKSIVKGNGSALSSGNIKAGQIVHLVYTGLVFQFLGEGGEYGTGTGAQLLQGYTIGTGTGIQNGQIPIRGSEEYGGWRRLAITAPMAGRAHFSAPRGAYLGSAWANDEHGFFADDPNFTPRNLEYGTSIFGLSGIKYYSPYESYARYVDYPIYMGPEHNSNLEPILAYDPAKFKVEYLSSGIKMTAIGDGKDVAGKIITPFMIDVTPYTWLVVEIGDSNNMASYLEFQFGLATTRDWFLWERYIQVESTSGYKVYALNISNLSGSFFFSAFRRAYSTYSTLYTTIRKVFFQK
ncbi:hypothetical protein [Desulfitobacterium sp. PCE1]|uniref:hypothetical protein n=1 Tax=Desulfitobacterium sp. PCE1 TaxID=146907 RepID=UPI000382CE63|nr:hypothetical protein [Desulfitobacterium sp. PCE1]